MDDVDRIAERILKICRTIAVVGCSRTAGKPSHDVPMYLQNNGYRIIPVNPNADNILGEKAYAKLLDIKEPIDVVDVFRPAPEAPAIAEEAFRIGAKALWLQEGIVSEEAARIAKGHGMPFVMDRCMMKEHYRLIAKIV